MTDPTPQPAPVDVAEGRPDETALGQLIWHSSGEDEGPDVGISVGLGSDRFLYFGELATATLADHDIDVKETGDGWWLVFYGPTDADTRVVALAPDTYAARDFMDRMFSLTRALLSAAEERDAAKAESGASTKTLLSLPSGDYPVHANVAAAFEAMRSERDRATAALRRVRDQMAECKWSVTPENAEANVKTASMFISAWNLREIDAALASLTKEGGE